ncbi:hypothetical protein LTR56_025701, partial [Elasticomyces elasticus]
MSGIRSSVLRSLLPASAPARPTRADPQKLLHHGLNIAPPVDLTPPHCFIHPRPPLLVPFSAVHRLPRSCNGPEANSIDHDRPQKRTLSISFRGGQPHQRGNDRPSTLTTQPRKGHGKLTPVQDNHGTEYEHSEPHRFSSVLERVLVVDGGSVLALAMQQQTIHGRCHSIKKDVIGDLVASARDGSVDVVAEAPESQPYVAELA